MELLNTALPALGEAFFLLLQPQQLLYLMMGVVLGLWVGIMPGIGAIAGLSLLLPFIYGTDAVSGLALMVGLLATNPTSDTFSSVLARHPGRSFVPGHGAGRLSARAPGRSRARLVRGLPLLDLWRHPQRPGAHLLHLHRTAAHPRFRPAGDADARGARPVHGGDPRGPGAAQGHRRRRARPPRRHHRRGGRRRQPAHVDLRHPLSRRRPPARHRRPRHVCDPGDRLAPARGRKHRQGQHARRRLARRRARLVAQHLAVHEMRRRSASWWASFPGSAARSWTGSPTAIPSNRRRTARCSARATSAA